MRVPSPDAALIAAADRLLGAAQRRGAPLPLVILPLCPLPAFASVALALTMPGIGQALFLPAWLVMAVVFAVRARRYMRALRADALAWCPDRAALYRRNALSERAMRGDARGLILLLSTIPGWVLAFCLSGNAPFGPWAWNAAAYLLLAASAILLLYARTALPHEPELRQPAARPAAA